MRTTLHSTADIWHSLLEDISGGELSADSAPTTDPMSPASAPHTPATCFRSSPAAQQWLVSRPASPAYCIAYVRR